MQPAVAELEAYAQAISVSDPKRYLWSNAGGKLVKSGTEYVSLLVKQVSSPVRWDLTMAAMVEAGITAVIEVCPGGTLTGLAKRSMPGVETLALKSPDQLDAALALISNHG
jgi:[acyl-carrier-protein] S-malonyltransferase